MINGIGGTSYMDYTQMSAMGGQMGNPFQKIDSNGDGSLDETELGVFADKISEMTGESVDVSQLISKLDSDEDGLVSQEEFEAGRPQGPPPGMMGMMGEMGNPFQEIDSNGDGSLDETELGVFADKISEMTGESVDVSQLITEFDSDEDGLVSQEEFEAGRPQGPPPGMMGMMGESEDEESSDTTDPLDTNGDGIVDAEEAKAGINYLIQKYQDQMAGTLYQDTENGQLLNLLG